MDWVNLWYLCIGLAWGFLLTYWLPRLWRAVGRRRLQHGTEARMAEVCIHATLVQLVDRDGAESDVLMCLDCEDRLLLAQTNGASSSAATPGMPEGRRQ
jgi:hypothetical protein